MSQKGPQPFPSLRNFYLSYTQQEHALYWPILKESKSKEEILEDRVLYRQLMPIQKITYARYRTSALAYKVDYHEFDTKLKDDKNLAARQTQLERRKDDIECQASSIAADIDIGLIDRGHTPFELAFNPLCRL